LSDSERTAVEALHSVLSSPREKEKP
jgi:hypothetical protein